MLLPRPYLRLDHDASAPRSSYHRCGFSFCCCSAFFGSAGSATLSRLQHSISGPGRASPAPLFEQRRSNRGYSKPIGHSKRQQSRASRQRRRKTCPSALDRQAAQRTGRPGRSCGAITGTYFVGRQAQSGSCVPSAARAAEFDAGLPGDRSSQENRRLIEPAECDNAGYGAVVLGDVDGDGLPEIVTVRNDLVATSDPYFSYAQQLDPKLLAIRRDATIARSWQLTGMRGYDIYVGLIPAIGDFNQDGVTDIAVAYPVTGVGGLLPGVVTIFNTGAPFHPQVNDWPMLLQNGRNTGILNAPLKKRRGQVSSN
jgi:hypothetical protein